MAPPTAASAQERVPHRLTLVLVSTIYTLSVSTQHCISTQQHLSTPSIASTLAIKQHIILDGMCTSVKHGSMVVYVRSMAEYGRV